MSVETFSKILKNPNLYTFADCEYSNLEQIVINGFRTRWLYCKECTLVQRMDSKGLHTPFACNEFKKNNKLAKLIAKKHRHLILDGNKYGRAAAENVKSFWLVPGACKLTPLDQSDRLYSEKKLRTISLFNIHSYQYVAAFQLVFCSACNSVLYRRNFKHTEATCAKQSRLLKSVKIEKNKDRAEKITSRRSDPHMENVFLTALNEKEDESEIDFNPIADEIEQKHPHLIVPQNTIFMDMSISQCFKFLEVPCAFITKNISSASLNISQFSHLRRLMFFNFVKMAFQLTRFGTCIYCKKLLRSFHEMKCHTESNCRKSHGIWPGCEGVPLPDCPITIEDYNKLLNQTGTDKDVVQNKFNAHISNPVNSKWVYVLIDGRGIQNLATITSFDDFVRRVKYIGYGLKSRAREHFSKGRLSDGNEEQKKTQWIRSVWTTNASCFSVQLGPMSIVDATEMEQVLIQRLGLEHLTNSIVPVECIPPQWTEETISTNAGAYLKTFYNSRLTGLVRVFPPPPK